MTYEVKRSIEEVFENYLEAMEKQDSQAMQLVWRGKPDDIMYSLLGVYEGDGIVHELMGQVLPESVAAIHTGRSALHFLSLTEDKAFTQAEYEIVLAYQDARKASSRIMIETQMYEKTDGHWKLAYVHQSYMPDHAGMEGEKRMDHAIAGMLEWFNARKDKPTDIPRSFKEKLAALYENMKNTHLDPDAEYLALQDVFLEERKRQRQLRVVPYILKEDAPAAVVQNEAAALAVDGFIAFQDKEQSFDPLLSMDAGLEMQRDIAAIMETKPREILALSGYHLPVKGLVVIKQNPVYGLFTPSKQEQMLHALSSALRKAREQGFRSVAITSGWHGQLHMPVSFAMRLLEEAWKYKDDFEALIFTASHSDERRALNHALEAMQVQEAELQKQQGIEESKQTQVPEVNPEGRLAFAKTSQNTEADKDKQADPQEA